MTYDRAAYSKMMEAVYEGRINAIIVKDLSRIGREQIETLNLIKKEFTIRNIRFIAVTDDYDSFDSSKSDGLSTSVKLLLNDYYCADISKKVRSAQEAKMKKGDFIGSHAPYGYIKDPSNKNHLIADEEAAAVIRKIFAFYIGGMSKTVIAKQLNADGIPNPSLYKQTVLKQNYVNSNKLPNSFYWTYSTINKILCNQVYTGCTVQHKSEIKAYNIHKKVQLPKEKWIIVENTHEAIIDKDTFETAQRMLEAKRQPLDMNVNLSKYTGLFFCKDCGRVMRKFLSKPKKDGSRYNTFKCGTYSSLGKNICSIHSVRESELDEIILNEIRSSIKAALDTRSCEYIRQKALRELAAKKSSETDRLKAALETCGQKRKTMLGHLSSGIISTEDFKCFDEENKKEAAKLSDRIAQLKEKRKDEQKQLAEYNSWLENVLQHRDMSEITRDILTSLVERVYISETSGKKEIEIVFKFKDPFN
ncbi:MAG: recombinase family protein [Firmicutes bacterium]|nr:recombinase family protein [Bacillota bacterium]MBQ9604150.1 recombinase family protein [Bacillota bacterium]